VAVVASVEVEMERAEEVAVSAEVAVLVEAEVAEVHLLAAWADKLEEASVQVEMLPAIATLLAG